MKIKGKRYFNNQNDVNFRRGTVILGFMDLETKKPLTQHMNRNIAWKVH